MTTGRINQIRIQTELPHLLEENWSLSPFHSLVLPSRVVHPIPLHTHYLKYHYQPLHMPNDLPIHDPLTFELLPLVDTTPLQLLTLFEPNSIP